MQSDSLKRLLDLLVRSHERRQPFFYHGWNHLYIGSEDHKTFSYGNPEQSAGIIILKKKDDIDAWKTLLKIILLKDVKKQIILIKNLFTCLNKINFDIEKLKLGQDKSGNYLFVNDKKYHVALAVDSHFAIMKMERVFSIIDIFMSDICVNVELDMDIVKKHVKYGYNMDFSSCPEDILKITSNRRNMHLTRGKDFPRYKNSQIYLRLAKEHDSLRFSGYISHEDMDIILTRPNMMLT